MNLPAVTRDRPPVLSGAVLLIASCLRLSAAETVWPDEKAWLKASPESQGMSSGKLAEAERSVKTPIGQAIVIRNGYEVWQYGDPYGQADGWWASSARSYTTTLYAMLIFRSVIPGGRDAVELPVNRLSSEAARRFKDDVRLKHLLSYTSCSNPAGSAWRYGCNWPAIHAIFTDLTGKTAWDFVQEELRPVLGGVSWRAIQQRDGTLRVVGPPADMARWGYCWLRGGRWKERRLVDEWFVEMATNPMPKPDGSGFANPNEGWQIHTNDGKVWAGLPADSYAALGADATSTIWVCPSLDLVIARLGVAPKEHDRIDEFLGPIVAAVESATGAGR